MDPALFNQERILTARLHSKTERQIEILSKQDSAGAAELEAEIRQLTAQYQGVEAKILAASPRYAAFAQPEPLTLRRLQREFLDADTLLLEYAVGEDRSFLWAVTRTTFRTFELPGRSPMEILARRIYENISARTVGPSESADDAVRELSRLLLGPVAAELGTQRLVVVTSGAIEYVPFGVLSSPSRPAEPLVASNEIVNLPSASTIAFLRGGRRDKNRPSKLLAVLADPVFSANDPRLNNSKVASSVGGGGAERSRSLSGFEQLALERLTFTRREAEDILALVPRTASFSALDFDASRSTVTNGALNGYRFVHIASHGLVNSLHPELSSIVLSLVDRSGHPENGFLQSTDIYNLKLNAELVVLSACQTALGKEVRGEGLVGLTRAFMYAGVPSVLASLWTVPDRSTAELMTRFYRGMLVGKMPPAAALREAQVSMWKESRWSRPYYWAAFILQGEWR